MRMKELQHYLGKVFDRDALGDRIDDLQTRLNALREHLPDLPASRLRNALPSYRDVRRRLPFAPVERSSYALPATLAVGGIAILGAIIVTAIVMSDAHKRTPKKNEDMGEAV